MFSFSSDAREKLVREVLQDLWLHTPRDHQIEAVGRLLDGVDVLTILPTGAGKTAILTMFMVILDQMELNPGHFPSHFRRFPEEPIIVVVCPTNCLEEQVRIYAFGNEFPNELRIVYSGHHLQRGINAETPERSDMWIRPGEGGSRILLLSPEQLISKRPEKLINNLAFGSQVCLLAVDEVHLLDSWGNGFLKAYQQIHSVSRLREVQRRFPAS